MSVYNEEKRLYELMESEPEARQSAAAQSAAAALSAQEKAAADTNYSVTADGQLDSAIKSYLSKSGYRYNANNDDAYREFSRIYGQNRAEGSRLSASGAEKLSGGYSPSYSQAVADAVSSADTSGAADYMPQFEQLAERENSARTQSALNLLNAYESMAQRQYQRGRDAQGDKMNYLSYLAGKYNAERQQDAALDSADTSIYGARLSDAAADLQTARSLDNSRGQFLTQSADSRARIAQAEEENARKIDYSRAEDAYNSEIKRLAAEEKAQEEARKQAEKAQEQAAKDERQHRINFNKITDYLLKDSDKKQLSAADRVDLDYNNDGKVDLIDSALAFNKFEHNISSSKEGSEPENSTISPESTAKTNEFIQTVREMKRQDQYRGMTLSDIAQEVIDGADAFGGLRDFDGLSDGEKAFLFEYFGLA